MCLGRRASAPTWGRSMASPLRQGLVSSLTTTSESSMSPPCRGTADADTGRRSPQERSGTACTGERDGAGFSPALPATAYMNGLASGHLSRGSAGSPPEQASTAALERAARFVRAAATPDRHESHTFGARHGAAHGLWIESNKAAHSHRNFAAVDP